MKNFLAVLIYATFVFSPVSAVAADQCNITVDSKAMHACDTPITSTLLYDSVRSDPGMASVPVDIWKLCRYLDNYTQEPVTASFRTETDWTAFTGHPPFPLVHCSRPSASLIVPPGPNCHSPSPAKQTVSEPDYYRWNLTKPATFEATATFKCTDDATGSWTQKVVAVFGGLDADQNDPSWILKQVTYTGGANEKGIPYPPCRVKCEGNGCERMVCTQ